MKRLRPKQIKEVIIAQKKIPDSPKTGVAKNDKKWSLWDCGIMVGEKWFNAAFFNREDADRLYYVESGKKEIIVLFQEQYQKGDEWVVIWKWRWPTDIEEALFYLKATKSYIDPDLVTGTGAPIPQGKMTVVTEEKEPGTPEPIGKEDEDDYLPF